MNERVMSASRYAAPDARYSGRTRPPPPPGMAAPLEAPPAESSAHRPRAHSRRMPAAPSARYQMPRTYNDEIVAPVGAFDEVDDDFQLDDELKMEFDRSVMAHRRPQRMKYVKCKTRVQPDLLVPYLYGGDRRSRVHEIIERTGCTIDYCPESPGDEDIVMDRSDFMMNFLVTAETSPQLEAATRLLRVLVDKVQIHVENKLTAAAARRVSTERRDEHEGSPLMSHSGRRAHTDSRHSTDAFISRYPSALKTEPQEEPDDDNTQKEGRATKSQGMASTDLRTSAGLTEMARQRHSDRWIEEERVVWPAHAHLEDDPQHYRTSRHYAAPRFHRPVYRRILVDEDGYEVVYPPQFDHVRRLSPRLSATSAVMSSPPVRRRRPRDVGHYVQETSSSDGETGAHGRRDAGMRAPGRAIPGGARPVAAGVNNASFDRSDAVDISARRGMKRRLDVHRGENIYPHYRMNRRSPAVYECTSDGDDDEMFISGDEYIDDMYDDSALPWYANERGASVSQARVDNLGEAQLMTDQVVTSPAREVGKEPELPTPGGDSQRTDAAVPERVKTTSWEGVVDLNESKSTLENVVLLKSTLASSSASSPVATEVSIAFGCAIQSADNRGADPSSDAESEKAIRTAVMPHRASVHQGMTTTPSQGEPDVETIRGIERVDGNSSITNTTIEAACSGASGEAGSEESRDKVKIDEGEKELKLDEKPKVRLSRSHLNDIMKSNFDKSSLHEAMRNRAESSLLSIAKRAANLATHVASHQQLHQLASIAQDVESEVWRQKSVHQDAKKELSATLEAAIRFASDSSNSTKDRVVVLRRGLEEVISREVERLLEESISQAPEPTATHVVASTPVLVATQQQSIATTSNHLVESPPRQPPTVPFVSPGPVKDNQNEPAPPPPPLPPTSIVRVSKYDLKRDSAVAKLTIPREAPSFVSELVLELERSTGLSSVMASAQKRLLREISKSDPYYYLHTMQLFDGPRKGRTGSSCPFGCSGVSAQKWERKVVSQISSRMKWFDSVAYSLAKVSGGKELLSRKKLNSTVRKLHLVALQLHCLIGHLFCLRKRAVCREIDSLPTALNNSYYEKRMNGYKSRLKLTVYKPPSPLHATGTGGTPAPPEELLRDTFEFYPELLLCVDIWGYDDRQGTPESKAKVPSELFRKVSQLAFDFENDTNGLLQSICEELLSILCQWNDFKWGESLESLTVDDIVAFEAKVKASIRKILDAHATHLLAQWSGLLLHKPLALKHVRLTQANVYYSEQPASTSTQPSVVTSNTTNPKSFLLFRRDDDDDDDEDMNEEEEDSMVHNFWRTRFNPTTTSTSTSSSSSSSSSSTQSVKSVKSVQPKIPLPPLNLTKLHEHDLIKPSTEPLCDEDDMRQRCLALYGAAVRLEMDGTMDEQDCGDVGDLLRRLSQARSVVEEAIRTSEQLTRHSVRQQHTKRSGTSEKNNGGSFASLDYDGGMSDASRDDDDAIVEALLASTKSSPQKPGVRVESTNQAETCLPTPHENEANADGTWTQPMMKDLLEIVASTNHEISDICGQRARSARVRDKLQSQSLDLARQSIQIFQTILNMKP